MIYVAVATTLISFNLKQPASSCSDNLKNRMSYVLICYQKSSQGQEMLRLRYISTNVVFFFCVILGRAHSVISKACAVLGSAVDLPLFKDEL